MGVGTRLAELLRDKNTNVHEVARATGISPSTLYSLIQRDSVSANVRDLSRLARHLGVGIEYFDAFGDERHDPETETACGLSEAEAELIDRFRTIDDAGLEVVLSVLALEAKRSESGHGASLGELSFDFAPVSFTGCAAPSSMSLTGVLAGCRCIAVSDASMEPLYPKGGIAVIRTGEAAAVGECGIFRMRDNVYFRQLGLSELRALNPAFPSVGFHETVQPICLGLASGCIHPPSV